MNVRNDFFRSIILARETSEKLRMEGYSNALAKRLVLEVINEEEAEMRKHNRPFDDEAFIKRLKQLLGGSTRLERFSD